MEKRDRFFRCLKRLFLLAAAAAVVWTVAGCGQTGGSGSGNGGEAQAGSGASAKASAFDYGGKTTLRILSGSENKELSGIIDAFAKKEKINIEMDYRGSVDIMRALQSDETSDYDAVWPAGSMWIQAGDSSHKVKHQESISVTPVCFGIRESLARELGFEGREVSVSDLLDAIESGKLKFCMTSATQSNSGCSAYIGFLYALLGNPDMIRSEDLKDPDLQTKITALLSGVDRSSGSSDWLKDLYLTGDYDAMVNYECLIIAANQELEKEGKETMYVVYPYDGLSLADSPLGYIDNGDQDREDAFLKFQSYLLSDEVQKEIQKTGRRTGYDGVSDDNKSVFNEKWGVQPDRVLSPIRMPDTDVLMEALDLYQTNFRKPSLTVYCLDYSGSMAGEGNEQLVSAMQQILVQSYAKENLLQASENEVSVIIPFSADPIDVWSAEGNGSDLEALYTQVEGESIHGGTDIYAAVGEACRQLKHYDLDAYTPAIILMTDGVSDGRVKEYQSDYDALSADVPIFSIMFGDADSSQLQKIADATNARVFDGRTDLVAAFRAVKGYN